MLELRILVDNIDYDSVAEYLIPVVAEKLLDKGNRAARDKGIGVQLCDVAVQKL